MEQALLLLRSLLEYVWSLRDEISGEIVATAIIALASFLLFGPWANPLKRGVRRRFPRIAHWFDAKPAPIDAERNKSEELYLGWLKDDLKKYLQPLVSTPAHTKRTLPEHVKRSQARLWRFDPRDYIGRPALLQTDLATRVEYGHGVRIKNLVKELRRFSQIVVLGDPGSGKSVCLRQLAFDLCESELTRIDRGEVASTLPIYVEMTTYDGWADDNRTQPMPVIGFLRKSLRERPVVREAPGTSSLVHIAEDLEDILRAGRATLIFDALDEMPRDRYRERYQALKNFVATHARAGNQFVFSCRALDYDTFLQVSEVVIDRFDRKRIHTYLKNNAPEIADALYHEIENDKALEDLASNPFFLHALTRINLRQQPGSLRLPSSRGKLLEMFAETLMREDVGIKQEKDLAAIEGGLDTLRRFLSQLAFALQQGGEGRTSATPETLGELWRHYPQYRRLLGIAHRARILGKSSQNSDQLVDAPPPEIEPAPPARIEFMHHRLQEYFAAEQLGTRLLQGEPVERYVEDIWWQETVIFAIGLVNEPERVLEEILAPRDDVGEWLSGVLISAHAPFHADEADAARETAADD